MRLIWSHSYSADWELLHLWVIVFLYIISHCIMVYLYIHICMHIYIYIYYIHNYIHIHVYIYIQITCVCVYVYVYIICRPSQPEVDPTLRHMALEIRGSHSRRFYVVLPANSRRTPRTDMLFLSIRGLHSECRWSSVEKVYGGHIIVT